MTAEGWGGESVQRHVESAAAAASEAQELAETALDEIASLRAELGELAAQMTLAAASVPMPPEKPPAAGRMPTLYEKVAFIRREMAAWHSFAAEAEEVRAAQREWRAIDRRGEGWSA